MLHRSVGERMVRRVLLVIHMMTISVAGLVVVAKRTCWGCWCIVCRWWQCGVRQLTGMKILSLSCSSEEWSVCAASWPTFAWPQYSIFKNVERKFRACDTYHGGDRVALVEAGQALGLVEAAVGLLPLLPLHGAAVVRVVLRYDQLVESARESGLRVREQLVALDPHPVGGWTVLTGQLGKKKNEERSLRGTYFSGGDHPVSIFVDEFKKRTQGGLTE